MNSKGLSLVTPKVAQTLIPILIKVLAISVAIKEISQPVEMMFYLKMEGRLPLRPAKVMPRWAMKALKTIYLRIKLLQ